jgi:hypothetical protein
MKPRVPQLDSPNSPALLDVYVRETAGWLFLRDAVFAAGVMIVLAATVAGVRGRWLHPTIFLLAIVPAVIGVRHVRKRVRDVRKCMAALESVPHDDLTASDVERFLHDHPFGALRFARRHLARYLARGGFTVRAIRVGVWKSLIAHPATVFPLVRPLDIPFEPLPLDERDDAVRHFLAADGERVASRRGRACHADSFVRRVAIALRGGWGAVGGAAVWVCMVGILVDSEFRSGSGAVSYGHVVLGVIPCFFWAVTFVWLRRSRSRNILVVPGGLVVRTPKRRGWRLEYFTRETSAICCYRVGAWDWSLILSNGGRTISATVSDVELDFALRAWLSPVDPPHPDRLTDLT